MKPESEKLLTDEQLCDILEVYLGRERGRKECHRLIDEMRQDPKWRAQMDSLGSTVRIFQRMECEKPPEDVCFRLMKVLKLDEEDEESRSAGDAVNADRKASE